MGSWKIRGIGYGIYKMSHLIYEAKAPVISGEVSLDINRYFSIVLGLSTVFANDLKQDDEVNDYDWQNFNNPTPNLHSKSGLSIEKLYSVDIGLNVLLYQYDKILKFMGILGYKNSYFHLVDEFGGEHWYFTRDFSRLDYGNNDAPGLDYKQIYRIPYIGFKGIYNLKNGKL